jgi:hypothetical protein
MHCAKSLRALVDDCRSQEKIGEISMMDPVIVAREGASPKVADAAIVLTQ